ncbi:MAG TPA: hypothetical protein VM096_08895 [Vicinamibacterales bacterium]|nr:hypothetical protein [Vicinamibacterales bacterium]
MLRVLCVAMLTVATANAAAAQTPQPFPRPNSQKPAQPPPTTTAKPPAPAPSPQAPSAPQAPAPKAPTAPQARQAPSNEPTEEMLGAPIYPSAVYLASYDAGRGQRFYLFGSTVPYAELVAYYKTTLKQKGDELFEAPPTHQFETAKFRDESMAFAPSVTIKDYTYGGSAGYPNPKKDGSPARFPSVIQIVPAPR